MQQKRYFVLSAGIAVGFLVTGCARPGERGLVSSIRAFEDSVYTRDDDRRSRELTPDATLEKCLAYAESQNPRLEAAFYRWKATAERIPQVRTLPDPRLSYAYYLRSVETRVGPTQHGFAISQTFPWFGELAARGDAALEAAKVAEQHFEALRLGVFFALSRAYAEHYHLAQAIRITDENVELMRHWEEVARAKFRAGTGTHAEVIQAQVEIGVLTDRLRNLSDQRGAVLAELNSLLSRNPDAALAVPDSLPDETAETTDDELLVLLREASPELRALRYEIERRHHQLTLGFGYLVVGEAANPALEDSGKDPMTAMISVNVPLWRGKYAAGTREAEARLSAARLDEGDRILRLEARVKRAAFELRDAGRRVRLYRDTLIPKADQSLRATSTDFEAGRLEFLNVIDAQRVLLEFGLAYERALSDQLSRLAEIEMLVGQRLPRVRGASQ
jgi:outer membrane protein TolC